MLSVHDMSWTRDQIRRQNQCENRTGLRQPYSLVSVLKETSRRGQSDDRTESEATQEQTDINMERLVLCRQLQVYIISGLRLMILRVSFLLLRQYYT